MFVRSIMASAERVCAGWRLNPDGGVFCLDAQSGELVWEYETGPVDWAGAGPVLHRETLYIASNEGVYALDIDSGDLEWNLPMGSPGLSVSVAGGVVYVSGIYGWPYVFALHASP